MEVGSQQGVAMVSYAGHTLGPDHICPVFLTPVIAYFSCVFYMYQNLTLFFLFPTLIFVFLKISTVLFQKQYHFKKRNKILTLPTAINQGGIAKYKGLRLLCAEHMISCKHVSFHSRCEVLLQSTNPEQQIYLDLSKTTPPY